MDTPELYYYRARYYDPQIERFLSEDPIGFASGDFNWYRYVGNSPVNLVDPWGLEWYKPWTWKDDYKKAKDIAKKTLQDVKNSSLPGKHNGLADAYRHCLWSCKMAYELGTTEAWLFGTGHEVFDNKLSPYNESQMDLANNCKGRELGSNGSSFTCEVKCMNALKNGDLIITPPTGGGVEY